MEDMERERRSNERTEVVFAIWPARWMGNHLGKRPINIRRRRILRHSESTGLQRREQFWWKNVDEPIVKREGGQNMLTARGGCFAKTIV